MLYFEALWTFIRLGFAIGFQTGETGTLAARLAEQIAELGFGFFTGTN